MFCSEVTGGSRPRELLKAFSELYALSRIVSFPCFCLLSDCENSANAWKLWTLHRPWQALHNIANTLTLREHRKRVGNGKTQDRQRKYGEMLKTKEMHANLWKRCKSVAKQRTHAETVKTHRMWTPKQTLQNNANTTKQSRKRCATIGRQC